MAGIFQGGGFEAAGLCDMVGEEGLVPAEGNCINISSRIDLTDRGLHPCLVTKCSVI